MERTPVGRTIVQAPRPAVAPLSATSFPFEWTRRESNPGCRHAIPASYRLDHEPTSTVTVEPRGVEPRRRACKAQVSPASDPVRSVEPAGSCTPISRVRGGRLPVGLRPQLWRLATPVTSVGIEPTRLAAAGSQPTLATSYSTRSVSGIGAGSTGQPEPDTGVTDR